VSCASIETGSAICATKKQHRARESGLVFFNLIFLVD
jgi:hypothetical protein